MLPGGNPGKLDPKRIDQCGPRWMVVVGICLFMIGVAFAL